jgi:uncharacterized protein YgiM (DUF1202 family)
MRILSVILVLLICASVMAEEVWVKRRKLDIRAGKGAAYEVVATVDQGSKLTVIQHDGKWLKVQIDGKEGYVYEDSISPREVVKQQMSFADANAEALSATAGSKGLNPGTQDWANQHNVQTAGLEKMISMRSQITGADYEQFITEGNLNR